MSTVQDPGAPEAPPDSEGRARVLHEEARRRLREAEALLELSSTLGSTLDMARLVATLGQAVARACDMERCTVFGLADGRLRPLGSQFADGRPDETLLRALRAVEDRWRETLPFLAAALDRPRALALHGGDPALAGAGIPGFRPRALLVLPLLRQQAVRGALVLDRSERAEPVSQRQVALGTAVAARVAAALDNARLYERSQRALTELRETQDRLARAETLRALGDLAGGAAHHLNNLLTVVVGRAQILLQTPGTEPFRPSLGTLERAAGEGAALIRRIQRFAQARGTGPRVLVDLNAVVHEVVALARGRWQDAAAARGLAVHLDCALEPLPRVWGDPAALQEALTELVRNATEALPNGGRVALATRVEAGNVVVTVTDEGVGMSGPVLRRAPEPFFTTKGVRSTGLGLSVSHGVLRQHGGDLTIASTEGRGTTVTMRIPLATGGVPAPARPLPGARS